MPSRRIKSTKFGSVKIMDSLSAFDDLYTAIEACLIYPDEVIDRLARAFYPAILACWNSEEGQREFATWQAEQAHHATSKEKQSVPDGERPVIHIAIACGFFRVRPIQGRTLFFVLPYFTLFRSSFFVAHRL